MIKNASHYKLTTISCFSGIFVQAIITNITAILFVPMMRLYGFTYIHLGILVGVNFLTQVSVDLLFSGIIDRTGFRKLILPASLIAFFGLLLFGFSPWLFQSVFVGILISTIVFSASAGLMEVLLSPIINAIPNDQKGPAMGLLHSFYAWGQVAAIAITTLYIYIFKAENWQFIVFFWSIIPLTTFFLFLRSPFPDCVPAKHRKPLKEIFRNPFMAVVILAIFFGAATELVMNQFASSFMENAILLPKLTGDLVGAAGYGLMLGIGRIFYVRKGHVISIYSFMLFTSGLAVFCYAIVALSPYVWLTLLACAVTGFASSMLWPGTLIAAADYFPLAGSWIFAILAASGDIGAAFGPWITSVVMDHSLSRNVSRIFVEFYHITAEQASIRIGILFAAIFPLMSFFTHLLLKKRSRMPAELPKQFNPDNIMNPGGTLGLDTLEE